MDKMKYMEFSEDVEELYEKVIPSLKYAKSLIEELAQ